MIVRITNQWGTILQQDTFPGASNVNIGIDPETFSKLFTGEVPNVWPLLRYPQLRIEVLPDADISQDAQRQDCPWCTNTDQDMNKHLRICPERLGPQDTARLRLVRGS